jgi:hypothetical protein
VRTSQSISFCLLIACLLSPFSLARAIENDPKKEYTLDERHGPWMVMVATFRDIEDEKRKTEGLSADAAANKLVHELRAKGIPAYQFSQDARKGEINSYDRLGNRDKRVYAAQRGMICVLAGNYQKVDEATAQKTLAYVKKYQPKFMANPKDVGAVVRNDKGPFATAFLTINPLLAPGEVTNFKTDLETKTLNSGIDYPLVGLKRKYTLKVATFTGKSVVPVGNSKFNGNEAGFERTLKDGGPYNLARAGEDATQLTYALRQGGQNAREMLGRDRFEAYVYHDKFQSIVTVGGFDSESEPEINRLAEIFKAKYQSDDYGEYALIGKSLALPNKNPSLPPVQTWAFDPVPELIAVPRIK